MSYINTEKAEMILFRKKNTKVKVLGLDCDFDENGEMHPIVHAKYLFKATVPVAYSSPKGNTYYKDEEVEVLITTIVDCKTPYNDLLKSANLFADIWTSSTIRHERHIYEDQVAKCGVYFTIMSNKYGKKPETLMELHKAKEYTANSEL